MRALLSVPSPLIFVVVVVAASLRTLRSKDRTVRDTNSVMVNEDNSDCESIGSNKRERKIFQRHLGEETRNTLSRMVQK